MNSSTSPSDIPAPRGAMLQDPRRRRLLKTTTALFASQGIKNVSLEDIAEAAHLSLKEVKAEFPTEGSALAASLTYMNMGVRDSGFAGTRPRGWDALDALVAGMVRGSSTVDFSRLYHDALIEASVSSHPAHDWLIGQQSDVRGIIDAAIASGLEDGHMTQEISASSVHHLLASTLLGLYPASLVFTFSADDEHPLLVVLAALKTRYGTPAYVEGA